MSRSAINFLMDATLLVVFGGLAWTSGVVRLVFPPGPEAGGWRLWGYDYEAWCDAQFACLSLFTFGILMHLVLHWNWVCGFVTSRLSRNRSKPIVLDEGNKTLYGVSLLIILLTLLGAMIGVAVLMIEPPTS